MTIEKILEYYKNIPEIAKEIRDGKHANKLTDYIESVRIKELAANKAGFSLLNQEVKNYWMRSPGMILSPCCIMAIERAEKDGFNPAKKYDEHNRCSRCRWCPLSRKHRYKDTEYQCHPNWDPTYRNTDAMSPEEELDLRLNSSATPMWLIEKSVQEIMDGITEEEEQTE